MSTEFKSKSSQFTNRISTTYAFEESKILSQDLWRVMNEVTFFVGGVRSNTHVTIPRGYLVDGASVPRILWSIIPPWGRYGDATVVHDILCEYLSLTVDGRPCRITRERADSILLEAMLDLDVDRKTYTTIMDGVNLYRKVANVTEPKWNRRKAELEALWVAANPA